MIDRREDVYEVIDGERDYQNNLPQSRTDGPMNHTVGDFLTLIRRYSVKADEAYANTAGNLFALHEIRKIAALAVACMEVHGAPKR